MHENITSAITFVSYDSYRSSEQICCALQRRICSEITKVLCPYSNAVFERRVVTVRVIGGCLRWMRLCRGSMVGRFSNNDTSCLSASNRWSAGVWGDFFARRKAFISPSLDDVGKLSVLAVRDDRVEPELGLVRYWGAMKFFPSITSSSTTLAVCGASDMLVLTLVDSIPLWPDASDMFDVSCSDESIDVDDGTGENWGWPGELLVNCKRWETEDELVVEIDWKTWSDILGDGCIESLRESLAFTGADLFACNCGWSVWELNTIRGAGNRWDWVRWKE